MYIVRRHKLVFLPLPKNGSRTMGVFFEHQLGGSSERTEHHAVRPSNDGELRDFTAVAIVRNPFSRMVSKWWEQYYNYDDGNGKTRRISFQEYVRGLKAGPPGSPWNTFHLATQCSVIDEAQKYYDNPIKVLRLENIAEDWIKHKLDDRTGLNFPAKTKKFGSGSSEYGDWTKYYNQPWIQEKVASVYYADLDRFGYPDRVK